MRRTKLSRRRLLPALVLAGVALGVPPAASATTFSNNAGITINDGDCPGSIQAQATSYPSTIAVSPARGRDRRATPHRSSEPPPTDGSALTSGAFKPSNQLEGGGCRNFSATSSFPAPAPAGPYGSTLGGFNGSDPNGEWRLYVVDDFQTEPGSIAGWSLDITSRPIGQR